MGEKLDRQIAVAAVLAAGLGGGLIVSLFPETRLSSVGMLLSMAGFLLLPRVGKALVRDRSETAAPGPPRPNWLLRFMLFFGALAVAWFAATAKGESLLVGPLLFAGFALAAYSTLRPARS